MRELSALYNALENYGEDSELEIVAFGGGKLVFSLKLDVANSEKYALTLTDVGHADLAPWINLGNMIFGGLELLPNGYLDTRWSYWESEVNLKVAKITSEDGEQYFVVYSGAETLEPETF